MWFYILSRNLSLDTKCIHIGRCITRQLPGSSRGKNFRLQVNSFLAVLLIFLTILADIQRPKWTCSFSLNSRIPICCKKVDLLGEDIKLVATLSFKKSFPPFYFKTLNTLSSLGIYISPPLPSPPIIFILLKKILLENYYY